jgi:hypothetical protein
MKTLSIKDLVHAGDLDRDAMATVRGGMSSSCYPSLPSYPVKSLCPPSYPSSSSSSLAITQDLSQLQSVVNATANGSAFIEGVDVHNNTSQYGQNNGAVFH